MSKNKIIVDELDAPGGSEEIEALKAIKGVRADTLEQLVTLGQLRDEIVKSSRVNLGIAASGVGLEFEFEVYYRSGGNHELVATINQDNRFDDFDLRIGAMYELRLISTNATWFIINGLFTFHPNDDEEIPLILENLMGTPWGDKTLDEGSGKIGYFSTDIYIEISN